jgi:hypothetical protein
MRKVTYIFLKHLKVKQLRAVCERIHDVKQGLTQSSIATMVNGRCTRGHAIYVLQWSFILRKPFTRRHNCLPNYGTFKNEFMSLQWNYFHLKRAFVIPPCFSIVHRRLPSSQNQFLYLNPIRVAFKHLTDVAICIKKPIWNPSLPLD